MLRNILVLFPAIALALPLISAQTTSARPLVNASDPARWGGAEQYEPTQEPGGVGDNELTLMVCTEVQILAEDRACELVPTSDRLAVCHTRGGKKPFKPGKKPYKPGKKPVYPGQEPVYPGQEPVYPGHDEEGGFIFVDITQCTALGIDINLD